jgi:hypothetical protein
VHTAGVDVVVQVVGTGLGCSHSVFGLQGAAEPPRQLVTISLWHTIPAPQSASELQGAA